MASNLPRDVVSTIVTAMIYRADGASLDDIVAAFSTPPAPSTVKAWLDELLAANLIDEDTTTTPHRYYATQLGGAFLKASASTQIAGSKPREQSLAGGPSATSPTPEPTTGPTPHEAGSTPSFSPAPTGRLDDAESPGANAQTQPPTATAKAGSNPGAGDRSLGASDVPATSTPDVFRPEELTAQFEAIFQGAITSIVAGVLPRASALAMLQGIASRDVPDVAKRPLFVQYGIDRLAHLSLGECIRLGLEPPQYELWRRQYFGASRATVPTTAARDQITGANPAAATSREAGANEDSAPVSTPTRARSKASAKTSNPGEQNPGATAGANAGTTTVSGSNQGELVAQLLTPIIDAALRSSPGAKPPVIMPNAPGSFPNPGSSTYSNRSGQMALPSSAANSLANLLANWIDRRVAPGGLNPAVRTVVVCVVGALLVGVWQWVGASPWLLALAALLTVVAALLFGRPKPTAATPEPAVARPVPDGSADALPTNAANTPPTPPGLSRRTRFLLAAGCVVAAATIVGVTWFRRVQQRPPTAAVRDYLTSRFAPLPVRVATLEVTNVQPGNAGSRLAYHAVLETTEPLFRRLPTVDYLRAHAASELAAIDAANALLNGPNGARLRAALGVASPTPDVRESVLLTTETPPGSTVVLTATLFAWRRDGAWVFTGDRTGFERPPFAGDPKPAGPAVFAVDLPVDSSRLKTLLADRVAYAAKVQAAAATVAAEVERERRQQAQIYAQLLRPGTLFAGALADGARGDSHGVVIEFTERSETPGTVVALLRNDGGWTDVRRFQGEWSLDAGGDACMVTLRTRNADRVDGAGPLLEDAGDRSFVLHLRPDGTTTAEPGSWQLRRVPPDGAAVVKDEFSRPLERTLAATKPGAIYRGTAVGKQGQAPELLVLRFVAQERDGVLVRATLESAVAPGRSRPFQGTIIGNSYRAGRTPIQLRSTDKERVVQADPKSILGVNTFTDSLALLLRVEGDRLVGENDRFTYAFEPTDAAAAVAASAPDPRPQILDPRAQRVDQGPGTRDLPAGARTPPWPERVEWPGLSLSNGTSASDSALEPRPETLDPARNARPLFGSSDVEQILVRSWKNFAAQPGAYVFFEGGWVPLPKNNGHAVQGLAQSLNGKLNTLSRWEDKLAGKAAAPTDSATSVAQILFDGRTKVPTAGSKNLTLLFVGPVEPLSAEILARNPELKTYPLVELAPLKTLPNGNRVAPLVEVGPGLIAFGPNRVDAMLETPVAGFTLLRCSVPLAPGRYALTAGNKIYEVNVE